MSATTFPSFDDLAAAVAVDGVAAHVDGVRQLSTVAYASGVSPTLLAILNDRSHPEVARMRALGRVMAALDTVGAHVRSVTTAA